jgi:hypothetical protein
VLPNPPRLIEDDGEEDDRDGEIEEDEDDPPKLTERYEVPEPGER